MSEKKNIVLLAGPSPSTNIVYNALKSEFFISQVIVEDPVPRLQFLKRRLKKLGLATVIGQLGFRLVIVPWLNFRSASRIRQIKAQLGLDDSPLPRDTVRVRSVNSDTTIALLREARPTALVINGTRIIGPEVLACVPAVFINVHAGITPLYRGVHGAYWALVERNRGACGVTVHAVDAGIDTGSILAQALIDPGPDDDFVTYPYLQLAAAIPLLKAALRDACAGRLTPQPAPPGKSKMWSHPTIGEYLKYRLQYGVK